MVDLWAAPLQEISLDPSIDLRFTPNYEKKLIFLTFFLLPNSLQIVTKLEMKKNIKIKSQTGHVFLKK